MTVSATVYITTLTYEIWGVHILDSCFRPSLSFQSIALIAEISLEGEAIEIVDYNGSCIYPAS